MMDKVKTIWEIEQAIWLLNEKICELNPIHDKKVFSFRHLLIMKRMRLIELIWRLNDSKWEVDQLISDVNNKLETETQKLLKSLK